MECVFWSNIYKKIGALNEWIMIVFGGSSPVTEEDVKKLVDAINKEAFKGEERCWWQYILRYTIWWQ